MILLYSRTSEQPDSYLGKIFFPFEDTMANIFPILRELGGLAPDTPIVVHEVFQIETRMRARSLLS